MSTPTATLPLFDILNQLIQDQPFACDLVQLSHGTADVIYRPASLLDDYRYRPLALCGESFYVFVEWHFRRMQSKFTTDSLITTVIVGA